MWAVDPTLRQPSLCRALVVSSRQVVACNILFGRKPVRTISGFLELISRFEFGFRRCGN